MGEKSSPLKAHLNKDIASNYQALEFSNKGRESWRGSATYDKLDIELKKISFGQIDVQSSSSDNDELK